MIGNASLVEAGSGVTLRDMTTIVSHDTRFPTEPYVVCEKLQGWSVVVDVFHGNTHPVSVSIRAAVKEIHPCLNRLAIQMGDDEGGGKKKTMTSQRKRDPSKEHLWNETSATNCGSSAPVRNSPKSPKTNGNGSQALVTPTNGP